MVKGIYAVSNLVYVAGPLTGLHIVDVRNPYFPVQMGQYDTYGYANEVQVVGHYAYVSELSSGLEIIDVSDPAHPVKAAYCSSSRNANDVFIANDRIYVADGVKGLLVLLSIPNLQFTLQIDASPGLPFTIQKASSLSEPIVWTTLLTTNPPGMPWYFTDFDVRDSEKYYRVRQP